MVRLLFGAPFGAPLHVILYRYVEHDQRIDMHCRLHTVTYYPSRAQANALVRLPASGPGRFCPTQAEHTPARLHALPATDSERACSHRYW